jgi:hypothetical protein
MSSAWKFLFIFHVSGEELGLNADILSTRLLY